MVVIVALEPARFTLPFLLGSELAFVVANGLLEKRLGV